MESYNSQGSNMSIGLTTEAELLNGAGELIDAWFAQHVHTNTLTTPDGIRLAYAWVAPKPDLPTIVISSGRVESYVKYKEVIFDLVQHGFAVFIHDHRGQGLSQRTSYHAQHGHVDDFAEYVADLKYFVCEIVQPYCPQPHLLCHSMGGAIGLLTTLKYPALFAKIAMTAPMLGLRVPVPMWLAHTAMWLGLSWSKLTQKAHYFLGQKDYTEVAFSENKLTRSQVRYQRFKNTQYTLPETQLGGVTVQWVAAANIALGQIMQQAPNCVNQVLCLSAESEQVVDNGPQAEIVKLIPDSIYYVVKEAEHEILFEQDHIRNPALLSIINFLKS